MKCNRINKTILLSFLSVFLIDTIWAVDIISINAFEIEKAIREKVENSISYIADEEEYIVNVEIEKFRKYIKVKQGRGKNPKKKRNKIIPIEQIKGEPEYLVYHRLGLSNTLKMDSDKSNGRTNGYLDKSEPIEEVIKSVTVEVLHSIDWSEEKAKKVDKLLKRLKFGLPVTPVVKMVAIDMGIREVRKAAKLKEAAMKMQKKSISDYSLMEMVNLISKFSTSIGLVLGMLILGLVAFLATVKFTKNQKMQTDALIKSNKEIAEAQQQVERENVDSVTEVTNDIDTIQGSEGNEDGLDSKEGQLVALQKFQSFMNDSLNESILFIKKWISEDSLDSTEALAFLALEMDSELLMKLLNELNSSERLAWKKRVSDSLGQSNVGSAYIKKQILEEVLVPSDLLSEKTKSLLIEVSTGVCLDIIREDQNLGVLLFSVLSTKRLTSVMDNMEKDELSAISKLCGEIGLDELKKFDANLQAKIIEKKVDKKQTLFGEKISELIQHVSPFQQQVLLEFVGQEGDKVKLKDLILRFFPMDGVEKLADDTLKFFLAKVAQKKLIELIVSSEEVASERYLSVIAPEGSPKRDMLNMEIENISRNEIELQKLKNNKIEIELHFLGIIRKLINGNTQVRGMVMTTVDDLVVKYMGDKGQDSANAA